MLFLCHRAALLLVSFVGTRLMPATFYPRDAGERLTSIPTLDAFCRWDCVWYERLAREGHWDAGSTTFFPASSWLAHGVAAVTGLPALAALLLVANLAALGTLIVLYRLFSALEGEAAAQWALTLFVLYPFSFFHASGFPEASMTFLSAVALTLALRGRHFAAAGVLAAAVWFKQLGILFGPGLFAAQLRSRWALGPKKVLLSPTLLALALPPLSLVAYAGYAHWRFGDALAFWKVRAQFGPLAQWSLASVFTNTDWNAYTLPIAVFVFFVLVLVLPGVLGLWKLRHFELAAAGSFQLAVLLVIGVWGLGRYSSCFWPAFLPLGAFVAKRPALAAPLAGGLAVCQGLFFFLFTRQFPIM